MRDQAEMLRLQMLKSQGQHSRSIAIVSGKGGVGKSNFSTNFAHALLARGKKVIIVDMDIGMGNIHILLGVTPRNSLKDYLDGTNSLAEVINRTSNGLDFISGGSGLDKVMEWKPAMFDRLMEAFEYLQKAYDFILFDMGAGATERAIDLVLAVEEVIVISTTEPTSVTDAYSMMKFICLRDPDKSFHLVSNRVPPNDDGNDTATRLQFAMRKFLGKETKILGFLPEDPAVQKAVLAQQPYILLYPKAPASKRMIAIAETFVQKEPDEAVQKESGFLKKLRSIFMKGRG